MTTTTVAHYDAQYGQFASRLYGEIRLDAFGADIGQNGWLTDDEHDLFIDWLGLGSSSRLLDVACGAGRTTLRIARLTGCRVTGLDIHVQGVSAAAESARDTGLSSRATFEIADATQPLPFDSGSFDALLCIDAINHLPDRRATLREWARLLRPGGRLVFTDPVTVTGPLTDTELAIRSSIGVFLFVPAGYDAAVLAEEGFGEITCVDRTENMARMAGRWRAARDARAADLRRIEGEATFEGQQRFLSVTSTLAAERRLSRFAYRAVKRAP